MAQSKVPTDPNLTPEMRRYLDDLGKVEATLTTYIDDQLETLPAFATEAEAEAGTSETVWMSPVRTFDAIAAYGILGKAVHVRQEENAGTDGGSSTGGAWGTRTLNTLTTNGLSASLGSNRITIPAGTYLAVARSPTYSSNQHRCRLRDITGGQTLILGSNSNSPSASNSETDSWAIGFFTISASSAIELQYYSSSSQATDGLGRKSGASGFGVNEVYGEIIFLKV